jgi:hypothetical protein
VDITISVPDGVFDEVSIVLNRFWKVNTTPQDLKANHAEAVFDLVKRDIEWWLNDCFSDGLADSLNDDDLEALGVPIELNKKEY